MKGFRAEPVVVERAARAVIYAATTFGLITWTDMQVDAVLTVVGLVVFPLVEFLGGWLLRSKVTSDDTLGAAGVNRPMVEYAAHPKSDVQLVAVPSGRSFGADH